MSNENNTNNEWKEREVGALWKKVSKKGNTILSGKINNQPVIIMVNQFKKQSNNPNAPDYRVYKVEDKTSQPATPAPQKTFGKAKPAPVKKAPESEPSDDTPSDSEIDF